MIAIVPACVTSEPRLWIQIGRRISVLCKYSAMGFSTGCGAMLIRQILSAKGREVVVTRQEATIAEVIGLLKAKGIGAVVVTDDGGRLSGIISERDIAHGLADHGAELMEMRVSQLMSVEVVTCTPQDGLEKLMRAMTDGRFRHLPVLEDGTLAGIISLGDVVKHRLKELEDESHMLQDYIHGAG
jgi:CBS domain-containing protein